MLHDLDAAARAERDLIVTDIHASFKDVTRGECGISWNECVARDNYESDEACEAARHTDSDSRWTELVDDPTWFPFPGIGGFSFINAEGFRYYLPPTMIRLLRGDDSEWYPGLLLRDISRFTEPHLLDLWSQPQLRCVARFVSFMARHDKDWRPQEPNPWSAAFEARWRAWLQ
jgi:hypothetical protein